MHELAITQSILSIVVEKAEEVKANKITRINLTIGEMSGIVADCVQFYFDFLSKDTIAAHANLYFDRPRTKLRCRHCGMTYEPDGFDWICNNCHNNNVEIIAGRECYVTSIEVD